MFKLNKCLFVSLFHSIRDRNAKQRVNHQKVRVLPHTARCSLQDVQGVQGRAATQAEAQKENGQVWSEARQLGPLPSKEPNCLSYPGRSAHVGVQLFFILIVQLRFEIFLYMFLY